MCWHWEVFGVGSWSKLKSKQASGRSSELMDWLFEPGSHRAVSGKLWAAVGRLLAVLQEEISVPEP